MGFYRAPQIVINGLVFYLDAGNTKSYPTTGTTWYDRSGYGNTGTLVNGPTFSSANNGGIVFDGVDDSIGFNNPSPISSLSFSINSIVSINTSSQYGRIVSKGHYGFTPGYLLQRYPDASGPRFSLGIGSVTSSSSSALFVYTTDIYSFNQFYCLSMVSTGTYLYLYINGIKVNLTKYSGSGGIIENNTDLNYTSISSGLSVTTSDKFSLGAYSNPSGPIGEYLNGKIFNTQIYNRALSQAEVLQNYNAIKTRYGL